MESEATNRTFGAFQTVNPCVIVPWAATLAGHAKDVTGRLRDETNAAVVPKTADGVRQDNVKRRARDLCGVLLSLGYSSSFGGTLGERSAGTVEAVGSLCTSMVDRVTSNAVGENLPTKSHQLVQEGRAEALQDLRDALTSFTSELSLSYALQSC